MSPRGPSILQLFIKLTIEDHLLYLLLVKQILLVYIVMIQLSLLCQLMACNTACLYNGQVMDQCNNLVFRDGPMMCDYQYCCGILRELQTAP